MPHDEEAVLSVLDACDAYLEAMERLRAILKRAFFALAQAKYAMGADKVTPLRINTTAATSCRVSASKAKDALLDFRLASDDAEPGVPALRSAGPKNEVSRQEEGTAAETRSCRSDDSDQTDLDLGASSKAESGAFSGLIGELAHKFGCLEADEGPPLPAVAAKAGRGSLPSIGGGLVSLHLRASRTDFRAALAQAIELLNSRMRLASALQRAGA